MLAATAEVQCQLTMAHMRKSLLIYQFYVLLHRAKYYPLVDIKQQTLVRTVVQYHTVLPSCCRADVLSSTRTAAAAVLLA